MLLLDITVVNVALPAIQKDLHTDLTGLQWVVDAYTLTLSAFTLTMGTLADRFGRRRLFVIGVGLFTLASLLCGLASDVTFLHIARGPAGHRRRGDVRDLARADRPGVPGRRARHRDRRLGRDDRRRRRGRPAGRRSAHRRVRLGVDLLRQRPDRDRDVDPGADPGRRVARSRRQAPRLGGADHVLSRALRADLRPAARQRRGLGQRADRRLAGGRGRPARRVRALRVAPGPRDVRPQPVPQAGVLGRLLRHLRDRGRDVRDVPLHHDLHAERDRDDAACRPVSASCR